jgi:hypothetical protein
MIDNIPAGARPSYHHKRESIDAHLTIVFAALAVTILIEARTGRSIGKFVRTAATRQSRSAPTVRNSRRLGGRRP